MVRVRWHWGFVTAVAALGASSAWAQTYVDGASRIPNNGGFTENVDFADVDGDGDRDAVVAEGGDGGDDQNKIWFNRGFEAGGTLGFFADRTATRFPVVLDDSRDMDFVDIDGDGDFDLYVSNTSAIANQTNRWWINMGGQQGGASGFFSDQTPVRWVNLGVNNGASRSSLAPTSVLASGGFIDWSCDCVFGDLDNDGDEDLYHSTYGGIFGGGVPSRIFRNNGAGFFEEFNPSGFQLNGITINNNSPALWCEGTQVHDTTNTTGANADIAATPLGVEIGDFDGDLDIDVLQGSRNEMPRVYRNRLSDAGAFVAFRDVTFASGHTGDVTGGGNYEQDMGDFDNDNDLDIYGLNWPGLCDSTSRNNGSGVFTSQFTLPNSCSDDNEGDFVDYDNDGNLDIFVANFSGQDRLYHNPGAPSWQHVEVTNSDLPVYSLTGLGCDGSDIDHDGDYDILVANDGGGPEVLLLNTNQIPDTTAPRLAFLEQVTGPSSPGGPYVVRVHVYDNSSWDVARYDTLQLEYSTNGGANWSSVAMRFSGGQLFRGEIPANVSGVIDYRVRATDEHGNVAVSVQKTFTPGCPAPQSYCTSGTSVAGCVPVISASGVPSAAASSGFSFTVGPLPGQRQGLIFYGISGRLSSLWSPGSTSFLCVKIPVQRTGVFNTGGTASTCNGSITADWLAFMAANPGALGQPLVPGLVVDAQCWFRDPGAPTNTNLSNGLEFAVCP
ncbi:MAG: VCBS repeat-containing protein [Planctomycetes bacterium]|nr:VCBS repeat-containing protein [Planctomycetota bacterium]